MRNREHSNTRKNIPYWLWAFLVNMLVAAVVIIPTLIKNKGYFAMSHDFAAEEISYNMLMNSAIKSGEILWNWGIDIGSNFIETFSFYGLGSPFVWLTLLFPATMVPKLMGLVLIIKFAVAGMISSVYFNRHVENRKLTVLASVLYAFSGYQCCSVVFYHFQDPVAFFPLLLIGVEKLVEEKKHGWLAVAVAVNALCNYVFFVAEVIFVVIFYVVKYIVPELTKIKERTDEEIHGRSIGKVIWGISQPVLMCVIEGVIGVFIAGILLVPSVYGTMSNSRISEHIPAADWFSMSTRDWLQLIKAFFLPAEVMNRNASVTYSDWMTNAAYLPLFGAMFAVTYAISKKDWLGRMLKVGAVCAVVPLLNNMFSFFSTENYRRWYFMLILLMALATVKVVEERREYKIKPAAIVSYILTALFVILTVMINKSGDDVGIYRKDMYIISLIIGVGGMTAALVIPKLCRRYTQEIYCAGAVLLAVFTLGMTISDYQESTDNTNQDFKTYSSTYGENVFAYLTEIPSQLDKDVLPYRYYFDEGIGHTYYNLAMTAGLPSINSFCSTVHSSINEYYDMIGVGRATWTNAGPDGIRELLGARYVVSYIEQPDYKYITEYHTSTGQTLKLYENENALPIGFTYDVYMTRSEFEAADDYLKPMIMLKLLIIEDEDEEIVSRYLKNYDPYVDGTVSYDDLTVLSQSHMAECSGSFSYGRNYFESVIAASNEKYAFFSVPYDAAWRATVNGKETEILNINGLMAVKVDAGSNTIRFDYVYKPLVYGIVLSIIGLIGFAAYVIVANRVGKYVLYKDEAQ